MVSNAVGRLGCAESIEESLNASFTILLVQYECFSFFSFDRTNVSNPPFGAETAAELTLGTGACSFPV